MLSSNVRTGGVVEVAQPESSEPAPTAARPSAPAPARKLRRDSPRAAASHAERTAARSTGGASLPQRSHRISHHFPLRQCRVYRSHTFHCTASPLTTGKSLASKGKGKGGERANVPTCAPPQTLSHRRHAITLRGARCAPPRLGLGIA